MLTLRKAEDMLWEFLPEVLKVVFEVIKVDKTSFRYDVYLDEIRVKSDEDRKNVNIVGKGYTDECVIQDHMMHGRPMYLHMRKCKWLDKESGHIFSYSIDYDEEEGTRLSREFATFLKSED